MDKPFYKVKEFAKIVDIHPRTLLRAIKNGRISAFRAGTSIRGTYRIPHSEIERLAVLNLEEVIKDIMEERKK